MILLDTNVVSELMRPGCTPSVLRFVARQRPQSVSLPSVVAAEIRYGLHRLPAGRRRRDLEQALAAFLRGFRSRLLAFDTACAESYAVARSTRETAGRPVTVLDALIGGMALAHRGATFVTRNTPDFDGYGLSLVNPWDAP